MPQSITGVWETCPSLLALSPWGLILDVQGFNLVSARAPWMSRTPLKLPLFREGKGMCEIILSFHQVVSKAPCFIKRQVLQHPSCRSRSRGEISMLWKIMSLPIWGENRWATGIWVALVLYSGCSAYYGINFYEDLDIVTQKCVNYGNLKILYLCNWNRIQVLSAPISGVFLGHWSVLRKLSSFKIENCSVPLKCYKEVLHEPELSGLV